MTQRSLLFLCAVSASCLILAVGAAHAYAFQTASKPNYDPPANLVRTDLPDWPYPKGAHEVSKPDDGQIFHIPGSTKHYTDTEINRSTSTVDWFPELHPAPPAPVIQGKEGAYSACGQCHLIDGRGKPDTADLQGLPVAYFLQQLADMKDDKRHASVAHASLADMIPVAKSLDEPDEKLAADYFHSVKAGRSARVVETDSVPVTHPGVHNVQMVDASGAKEPIGTRIIEVPEDVKRTMLRDATSGFIAYVPMGSVKRGELLAKTGGAGKTLPCGSCHGEGLRGNGDMFPPLAGRSPTATARQLYDFKSGTRDGRYAPIMKPVVARLTDQDIVDLMAYIASLQP
ncbi:MAG TPA: c-type cytochrome [Candidatus Acidoferrum sp.]|jgi:cytochrome c553